MKCIMLSVDGGVIEDNNMEWAKCQFWQIAFPEAFEAGVMTGKASFELVGKFKNMAFPAIVDAEFINTKGKNRNGQEIAISKLLHMDYLQALTFEDIQSLIKPLPKIESGAPVTVTAPAETATTQAANAEAVTTSETEATEPTTTAEPEPKRASGGLFGGR